MHADRLRTRTLGLTRRTRLPRRWLVCQLRLGTNMFHVHANVHAKWLYGTDTQAPSKRALHKLRTTTVNIFVVKKSIGCVVHSCSFQPIVTVFKPFSKWTLHVFQKLRKIKPSHCQENLTYSKSPGACPCRTRNRVSNVGPFLCHELKMDHCGS